MPADDDDERLLDIPTVADLLNTSIRHVRRLVDTREIPFNKVGGKIRFRRSAIRAWLAMHAFGPIVEPDDQRRAS